MTDDGRRVSRSLIERLHQAVADRVAEEKQRRDEVHEEFSAEDEREFARAAIASELDVYARELLRRGHDDAGALTEADELHVARSVFDAMYGLGPIQPYIDDPQIENVNINGCDVVWIKRSDGSKIRGNPVAETDEELIELIRRAATHLGPRERRFDVGSPELDLRLPDGSRLAAVMNVSGRPAVSIRRHRLLDQAEASLERLRELGAIDDTLLSLLRALVLARKTVVIAGGTNAGKTTLLRAMTNEILPHERLVTIEKSLELALDTYPKLHPDVVAMEAREANIEGEGAITMRQLVRRGLRLDPDRVIVGEVLGDEVVDMLNAMSQGNDGSMCTIHANSADGVFRRIATYAAQSPERLPLETTYQLIAGAVDFVVFIDQVDDRHSGGGLRRFVGSVAEVLGAEGSDLAYREIVRRARQQRAPEWMALPTCADELRPHGFDVTDRRRR